MIPLYLSILFAFIAFFLFAAASNHPAPSQTALIPAFFVCAAIAALLFVGTGFAYFVGLFL